MQQGTIPNTLEARHPDALNVMHKRLVEVEAGLTNLAEDMRRLGFPDLSNGVLRLGLKLVDCKDEYVRRVENEFHVFANDDDVAVQA